MKRMVATVIGLLLLVPLTSTGTDDAFDYQAWVQLQNIPGWVRDVYTEKELDKRVEFSFHLNPCYLRGDFNGDGEADVAVLVRSLSDSEVGIAVFHYGTKDARILGAGTVIGNGGRDFSWMNIWTVFRKGEAGQGATDKAPPKLLGDALLVEKSESASGLIYWDGEKYAWYQQGD